MYDYGVDCVFFFPDIPGAEIRSVCTEAGMFAIRSRRKVSEKNIKQYDTKVLLNSLHLSGHTFYRISSTGSKVRSHLVQHNKQYHRKIPLKS